MSALTEILPLEVIICITTDGCILGNNEGEILREILKATEDIARCEYTAEQSKDILV
jgi:hypothetical protein